MGYIEELRKFIGTYPIIHVGAAALIFDKQGRLLLLRRTDNGCWGISGGGMEPGESLADTVKRETREESGLEIEQMTLFDVFSGPEFYYCYPNGDKVYNVTAVYRSHKVSGSIQINQDEHTEARYFDLSALPAEISPPIRPILEKLIHNGRLENRLPGFTRNR
jgi:8-oxo-dGTP pyrophosphatase MutT (NUDIX family)